jgi:SAM-dependent MidA family methyltransferase
MAADDGWRRWRTAMADALYGPDGFYLRSGAPAAHFRTAAHTSPLWPAAWARLAQSVAQHVPRMTVVEIGAGGGELLRGLAAHVPPHWRLVGVDVCPRPPGLPDRIEWRAEAEPPASFDGLLVAVEWLDVVPVDVAERTADGLRLVEVRRDGDERLGALVEGDDEAWSTRWWAPGDVGDRVEIGRSRDAAWAEAVGALGRGLAVAVDYAVDPRRDLAGTLTGYRDGRQVAPVPDGSCDLTAHVLMESCAAAVAGAQPRLLTQREALRSLGVDASRPAYDGNPHAYLAALQATGEAAELLDPGGLGGFTWLMHAKGVPSPI